MIYLGLLLVSIPVVVFTVMLLVAVLGLLWAPFAALSCAFIAGKRGLSARRYAVAGAIYSILFLLPWFYLLAELLNRRLPGFLIRLGYAVLYIGWIVGIIGLAFLFIITSAYTSAGGYVFLGAGIVMVFLSWWQLAFAEIFDSSRGRLSRQSLLSRFFYLSPFIYAYSNTLLFFVAFPPDSLFAVLGSSFSPAAPALVAGPELAGL